MTHNIVAQFSCSLDEHGNFKEYRVVAGSVFNDEFSETLDSATIVLSQVKKEDRLSYIKPYDFVRVFDKSSTYNSLTNTYAFDKIYLVDNFNEKENNIKNHLFGYTINLMSETKLLEKIQCPNLTITHDIKNGVIVKKTIFQVIKQYMELYVPKIKFCSDGENWSYEPLIKVPGTENDTIYETTISVDFDDSDFEYYSGHGATFYLFEKDSSQLPTNVDYDSVEVVSVALDEDVDWIGEVICNFNSMTGVFNMDGQSNNTYYGTNVITYKYKVLYETTDFYKRFNVPCADLSFNCPTLRQLLTTLMQQVGCIPVVKNRKLTFLDFQQEAQDFGNGDYSVNDTVNYINRSLSSDSFVNSLVNISDQVLDSGNEVICETLGFRDSENLLLKQKENLKLETSFPIYKVNKCILHAPGMCAGYLGSSAGCFYVDNTTNGSTGNYSLDNYMFPIIVYKEATILNHTATIKFRVNSSFSNTHRVKVITDNIYFLSRNLTNGEYSIIETKNIKETLNLNDDLVLSNSNLTNGDSTNYWDLYLNNERTFTSKSYSISFNNLDSSVVGFLFSGTFILYDNNIEAARKDFTFIKFDDSDENVYCHDCYGSNYQGVLHDWFQQGHFLTHDAENVFIAKYDMNSLVGFQAWDITKLIVENSVRQLLDRDFQTMIDNTSTSNATIDELSKYVYGTVGYSIGSKTISGFSDEFVAGSGSTLGWITEGYTYIENIVNVLEKSNIAPSFYVAYEFFESFGFESTYRRSGSATLYANIYNTTAMGNDVGAYCMPRYTVQPDEKWDCNMLDFSFRYYNPGENDFDDTKATFYTGFFVDLYYQPLNSFNLAYVKSKEEVDYSLTQYDGNASGLTDFDRLSIHEQEQVDRFGNETLSINQRTTDYSDIQNFENGPLYFRDDTNRSGIIDSEDNGVDYIIFKRSFSIGNNCYNASYVGSKDAVLKDYFTSIRTKYRAYQYVDYNSSVLRKERDTLFVRIARDFYNGDDRIKLNGSAGLNYLIYDLNDANNYNTDVPKKISYELETNSAKVSNGLTDKGYVIENNQTVKNSVSCYSTDNMFGITYEYVDNVGAGTYIKDITENARLGGIPQSWQIWNDNYNEKHMVAFTNFIDFYSQTMKKTGSTSDAKDVIKTQIKNIEKSPIVDGSYPYDIVFWVCEDNTRPNNSLKRLFYKDYAERINHTVQFVYYTQDNDVLINEGFIAGTPMLQRYDNPYTKIFGSSTFSINKDYHDVVSGDTLLDNIDSYDENTISNFGKNYIDIVSGTSVPRIRVFWHGYSVIKMCSSEEGSSRISDIAVFKRPNSNPNYTDFYFTINDTKTDYVLSEKNGILYRRYKAQTYTNFLSPEMLDQYTVLNYIQNSGTQYLNLGFVPVASNEWSYELDYTDVSGGGSNYVMGSRVGSSTIYFGVTGAVATLSIFVANQNLQLNNYRVAGRRYNVKATYKPDGSGTSYLKNVTTGQEYTGEQTATLSGATANVCLFALQGSNIHTGMRVYSLKIYKNGDLFMDLIPAKRKTDNVLGMLDKVSGNFFTNAGSGTFAAGASSTDGNKFCPRKVIPLYEED